MAAEINTGKRGAAPLTPQGDPMVEANRKPLPRFFTRLREGCAAFACLFLYGTFFGCHPTPEAAVDRLSVGRSPRPIDTDPYFAEKLGQEALETIGYLPIINLARRAGWVTTKEIRRPFGGDRALISMDLAQAATAGEIVEVYSKYAVAAGVTSQLDSPLPGPFDIAAVGVLVIGLIHVGILASDLLSTFANVSTPATTSTTTSPPPSRSPTRSPSPRASPRPREPRLRLLTCLRIALETRAFLPDAPMMQRDA